VITFHKRFTLLFKNPYPSWQTKHQALMKKPEWLKKLFNKSRLFVVSIFVFAMITHLPYLAPGGPSPRYPWPLKLVIDEGTVLYDSFRITSGEVIYRDFFQFQGPVFYFLNAGLFAITGPSLTAARALNLFVTAIAATLIAVLIARILGPIAGIAAATVHSCLLVPMWPYAYPHWLAETLAFAGIYFLATNGSCAQREVAGGAFLGLSTLTIQSVGLPILGVCTAGLTLPGIAKRNWKEMYARPLHVLGGASISVVPFIFYFNMVGGIDQMWYAMFDWVFTHYPEGQKDASELGYGAFLESYIINHGTMSWPWRELSIMGLRLIKLLPVLALFGAIVATLRMFLAMKERSSNHSHMIIGGACLAGTITVLIGITRVDLTHVAFVGSFGLCGGAIALSPLITHKPRSRLPIAMAWAIVGILVILNFGVKTVTTYQKSRKMQDWKGEVLKLSMARWIDGHVGPHERIVVSEMGGLQYLYVRRAAVGFTFIPVNIPEYFSNEQWRDLGKQILKTLPPVIELTEKQWSQVTKRTPELDRHYQRHNRLLFRMGFAPQK